MPKNKPNRKACKKSFIKHFEKNVVNTINRFNLLSKKEKIIVAVSGGKDSTSVLYLLKKLGYNVEALTIDSKIGCYSEANLNNIKAFCKEQSIKLHIVSFRDAFGTSLCYLKGMIKNLKSCTICGVLRRYLINLNAKKLGADKVVTGHNMDDEAQAILLNFMKNYLTRCSRLGPSITPPAGNHFVPRVKPFYLAREKDIIAYSRMMGFPVKYSSCPCAEGSFRFSIRSALRRYEKHNPDFSKNIVSYFLSILPKLAQSSQGLNLCSVCNQPSANNVCRTCQIISMAR